MFLNRTSSLLGLAALGLVCSGLSAQAQMVESAEATPLPAESLAAPVTQADDPAIAIEEMDTVEFAATPATPEATTPATSEAQPQEPLAETVTEPTPVSTSAAGLMDPEAPATTPLEANPDSVAQFDTPDVDPGQATVSSPSYLGLGASIDFDDDTGLAVISKLGLTDRLSVRPSVATDFSEAIIGIPLTLDFAPQVQLGRFSIAPYIGGGVAFSVGDGSDDDDDPDVDDDDDGDFDVAPLLSAGVDVPLTSRFTANANANVAFADNTEFRLFLGVGYNFPGGLGDLFR